MDLPVPKRVIHRYGRNVQLQFWLLCAVVVVLVVVYGTVFWDSLGPRAHPHGGRYEHRQWEEDFPPVQSIQELRRQLDIHMEHDGVNNGDFINHHHGHNTTRKNTVAIGCAITSRDHEDLSTENMQFRLPFLRTLVPSFCRTITAGYDYHMYAAFDVGDPNLSQVTILNAFNLKFEEARQMTCPPGANVSLHFIQCRHNHNPAWAQNDAMMEAYLDNMEYFYRINDDTHMLSPGWTETFIEALGSFSPPFVGVAGPVHKGGNEVILTYDFVHRTHIDIFGYYYPRLFTDWWADDWITAVYGPERTIKLPGIRLKHTQEAGQRYRVQYNNEELVHYQVAHDKNTLDRYLWSRQNTKATNSSTSKEKTKKVISMSLWGNDPRYTFGAIRNAQLTPVYFPGWTLRVYLEKPKTNLPPRYDPTSHRIIAKLQTLGAEVMLVDTDEVAVKPMLWRFLVADDFNVNYFIVRDADARLSDRDAAVVNDWMAQGSPFHCVRDHPSHAQYSLSGGLWGAKPKELLKLIPIPWKNLMMGYQGGYGSDMTFLNNAVWPKVNQYAYCHDSFSCTKWSGAYPFPVKRRGTEHVGQVFDAFGYARDEDMKLIREAAPVPACTKPNATHAGPSVHLHASVMDTSHLQKLEESMEKRNKQNKMADTLKTQIGNGTGTTNIQDGSVKEQFSEVDLRKSSPKPTVMSSLNVSPNRTLIWSMDTVIKPLRDIKYILHNTDNHVLDKSLSSQCWETKTCATNLRVITKRNILDPTQDIQKLFFEQYENDPEMNMVSHFLCVSPPATCELYMAFDKPLIVYVTTRYEQARYLKPQWQAWSRRLFLIANDTRNTVAASSLYDAMYVKHYTGITPVVIPPLCAYIQDAYNPTNTNFLVTAILNIEFSDMFMSYFASKAKQLNRNLTIKSVGDVYPRQLPSQITSHPGIIYMPSQVSAYDFCEYYFMNVPLFVPSVELLARWQAKYGVISQLTHNNIRDLMGTPENRSRPNSVDNSPDPNNERDPVMLKYWLPFAQFYHKPHVILFQSVGDLIIKLHSVNFTDISLKMQHENINQKQTTTNQWLSVISHKLNKNKT